jgi:hypothetical protein
MISEVALPGGGRGARLLKSAQNMWLRVIGKRADEFVVDARSRLACVGALLAWQGLEIEGESEKCSVNTVDTFGNTPLHYAASNGDAGAKLSLRLFPCLDLALFQATSLLFGMMPCVRGVP